MTTPLRMEEAYARALACNRAAFNAGHAEAAYHFQVAALHLAEDAHDGGQLA